MFRAITFLCLVWASLSQAQSPAVLISTEDGLSQGMVFQILQSRDGFIWVATKDGLNRFDGYRFKVFSPDPFDPFAIAANEIRHILEDSRGRIWLAYEGGLDVLVPSTGHFFHLPMADVPGFEGYVTSIKEIADGTIWFECNGLLWRIRLEETQLQARKGAYPRFSYTKLSAPAESAGQSRRLFLSFYCTHRKELLASTSKGLYRISEPLGAVPRLQPLCAVKQSLHFLGESPSGTLYLSGEDGLWAYRGQKGDAVQKISEWVARAQWAAGENATSLWANDGQTLHEWQFSPQGLRWSRQLPFVHPFALTGGFYFHAFTIDRSGNAWLGTSGYGLLKLSTVRPKFQSYLPLRTQRQIVETPEGHLIAMVEPRRIYLDKRFDRSWPNPWFAQIPSDEKLDYALFDKADNCWVRSSTGKLFFIDAQHKSTQLIQLGGMGLWIDRKGQVLSLSRDALLAYNPTTKATIRHPFSDSLRFQYYLFESQDMFYEDSQGVLWIRAFEGLLSATPTAGGYRFTHYRNQPNDRRTLSWNAVMGIAEDPQAPERYLWIGTNGGGLNRLDRQSGQMTHYGLKDSLPDRVIYALLPDGQGRLWMSTNKGLSRMLWEGGRPVFKNFAASDGLQGSEFNRGSYLKTSDGSLIFGGVNGLTVFHPDSLRFRNKPPLTHIVGIRAGNESYAPSRTGLLSFRHNQPLLVFEFAALDFTNPARNQYRYQLSRHRRLGGESKATWTALGHSNSVQLGNLPPGRYTFRVLGSDDEGTWSLEPAEQEFRILPPWWASWWAYLTYIALLVLTAAGVFRFRLRRRMAEQEALRLRELDDFKNRFFTNITHEFRTPLTVILGASEQVGMEISKWESLKQHPVQSPPSSMSDLPLLRGKVSLIRRNGQNLLRLINQLLDLAKLESNTLTMNYVQGDVLAYLRYIAESLHSLAEVQHVMMRVESPNTEIVMDYDPDRLLQIAHNLLSNAIKFTPAGGQVLLEALQDGGSLQIRVSDTGLGIAPEALPRIFDRFYQADNLQYAKAGGTGIGLALTRELVLAMGGDIVVQSEVGKGTAFTVRLPIQHRASLLPATVLATDRVSLPRPQPPSASPQASLLIIEDNPDVVEYLSDCLGAHYALGFAYNGQAGIEKALENIPDLIVSDVMMPEKDGLEVVEALKNDMRSSHIPIVLLTAKADVGSRIAGLRRGADAYLAKPFHEEELLVTLENLLEGRRKLQEKYQHAALHKPHATAQLVADPEEEFLEKVRDIILSHLSDTDFSVDDLCRLIAMSQPQLHRKLTALTGKNATLFIRSVRLAKARELLLTGQKTVSEAAYEVGFSDPKYFSRVFTQEYGLPPSKI